MGYKLKTEDFVLDQSFCDFVTGTESNAVAYWNNWIARHPESTEDFNRAVSLVKLLLKARKLPVTVDKKTSLQALIKKLDSGQSHENVVVHNKYGKWVKAASILIIIGIGAVLWMQSRIILSDNEPVFTEIYVPVGEKAQVILPDNSHIWINSDSRLKYPLRYGKNTREVFLEGEAYFDVAKKAGKLFIVQTKEVKIKVLGTAFNVKNYGVDKTVETTVIRGRVQVESKQEQTYSVYVNPNEKAIFVKNTRRLAVNSSTGNIPPDNDKPVKPIVLSHINPGPVVSWKDQHLVFTDETFADMRVKMERWYNINIEIGDTTLLTERYNGKFVHNETIYQVLEVIKLTTSIDYMVKNNIIIITRK